MDLSPWQTAQRLAEQAVSTEESEYARDVERLADHEVEQAFAAALRDAALRAEHASYSGRAQALAQKVQAIEKIVAGEQAELARTGGGAAPAPRGRPAAQQEGGDLEVSKAQLDLDTDRLATARQDLARATGDETGQIQQELTAHQASMHQESGSAHGVAGTAEVSARQHGTLAGRVAEWFGQIERSQAILDAQQKALQNSAGLSAERSALDARLNAEPEQDATAEGGTRVAGLRDRSTERQMLAILGDRIETEQQLATVYGKWAAQVDLQHNIVLHLILRSLAWILFILFATVIADAALRRLLAHPALDGRQAQTLRSVLELSVQVVGGALVLLVIFGVPQQIGTMLGLATAALTVVLQDFIIAFFGWFVLVGRNGVHVGDWVEIDGVGGEVTELGLFNTTLLETGTLADTGHPTGRRIAVMNSYAIRGKYFNFSTTGQWMWDEIGVSIPSSGEAPAVVRRIHQAVVEETEENARFAESEWKRGTRTGLSRFSAAPVVHLRPSGGNIDVQVRYVTSASRRFETRNRLYLRIVNLLQQQQVRTDLAGAAAKA